MENLISNKLKEQLIKTLRTAKNRLSILSDNEMVRMQQPKNVEDARVENAITSLIPQLETLLSNNVLVAQEVNNKDAWKRFGRVELKYKQEFGKEISINSEKECFWATSELNKKLHLEC